MACQVCRREPEILYAGTERVALGQRCYNKTVKLGIVWGEEVTLAELRQKLRVDWEA